MKTQASRRRRGFTLVELLVVIAIIAVLAAAGFGMVTVAMNKAKNTKAIAAETAIEQAVNAFYNEYGRLPDPTGNSSTDNRDNPIDTAEAQQGAKLLEILLGKENNGTDIQNDKKIAFLTVNEAKNGKGGLEYNPDGTPKKLTDPWGTGFKVVLDFDYDEELIAPDEAFPQNVDNDQKTKRGRRVLVYSLGSTKKGGVDAVKNW